MMNELYFRNALCHIFIFTPFVRKKNDYDDRVQGLNVKNEERWEDGRRCRAKTETIENSNIREQKLEIKHEKEFEAILCRLTA